MKVRLEFKIEDMWVGVFWKRTERFMQAEYDVWVCLIPCLPVHITFRRLVRNRG